LPRSTVYMMLDATTTTMKNTKKNIVSGIILDVMVCANTWAKQRRATARHVALSRIRVDSRSAAHAHDPDAAPRSPPAYRNPRDVSRDL
jgi:hypothetical protein